VEVHFDHEPMLKDVEGTLDLYTYDPGRKV